MSTVAILPSGIARSVVRILVVDDHSVIREGLSLRIDAEFGMKIVGCVADGEEAIFAVQRLQPDVVIMDLVLPSVNGIDATRRIVGEYPQTLVIALSACHSLEHVRRAMGAGAHGYVLKSAAGSELTEAINMVVAGNRYFSREVVESYGIPALQRAPHTNPIEELSERERQILPFLVKGLTSAQVGRRLSLSCKTVETYRSRLMLKLGVSDRTALIQAAQEYELPEA
jgi:DNA-binding NarL/FixJ family response regulator